MTSNMCTSLLFINCHCNAVTFRSGSTFCTGNFTIRALPQHKQSVSLNLSLPLQFFKNNTLHQFYHKLELSVSDREKPKLYQHLFWIVIVNLTKNCKTINVNKLLLSQFCIVQTEHFKSYLQFQQYLSNWQRGLNWNCEKCMVNVCQEQSWSNYSHFWI